MAKILVVDYTNDLLDIFLGVLPVRGYAVQTVNSKNHFINLRDISLPDIILLDVRPDGEEGRQLCRILKNKSPGKNIPVILLSDAPRLIAGYEEFNVGDVIKKPFHITTVIEKVSAILAKKKEE